MLNILLKCPIINKCSCECYLYEKSNQIIENFYTSQKRTCEKFCHVNKYFSTLQSKESIFIWVQIISPFLNRWFLDSLQHSLVIRRLTNMPSNYNLANYTSFLSFIQLLGEETLLYKLNINSNKVISQQFIEATIKHFYKDCWFIFSSKNINEVYIKAFYININPILYYNVTSAHEITTCLNKYENLLFTFIPMLDLFQKDYLSINFDYVER